MDEHPDSTGPVNPEPDPDKVAMNRKAFECRLRYLVAEGFIEESSKDHYELTEGGRFFADQEFVGVMKQLFGSNFKH